MLRRFAAWVRFRWKNRRKPGRFDTADLHRDQQSRLPDDAQYDRTPKWPDSF